MLQSCQRTLPFPPSPTPCGFLWALKPRSLSSGWSCWPGWWSCLLHLCEECGLTKVSHLDPVTSGHLASALASFLSLRSRTLKGTVHQEVANRSSSLPKSLSSHTCVQSVHAGLGRVSTPRWVWQLSRALKVPGAPSYPARLSSLGCLFL